MTNYDELRKRAGLPPSTMTAADRASGRYRAISALVNTVMAAAALVGVAAALLLVLDLWLLPGRLPLSLLEAWPAFALALAPMAANLASALIARVLWPAAFSVAPSAAIAGWLRHRLDELDGIDVAILIPVEKLPPVAPCYCPSEHAIALGHGLKDEHALSDYRTAARLLGRALAFPKSAAAAALRQLIALVSTLSALGSGLLLGAVLAGAPALYPPAIVLLGLGAVGRLGDTAMELTTALRVHGQVRRARAARRPSAASQEQLRALTARLWTNALTTAVFALTAVAMALAAAPVAAAIPPDLLPAPAPPLTGAAAFGAVLAALAVCAYAISVVLARARVPAVMPLSAAAALAWYFAAPLLAVLLWNQPTLAAPPWVLALALASAWAAMRPLLFVPLTAGAALASLLRLWPRRPRPPPRTNDLARPPEQRPVDELRRLAPSDWVGPLTALVSASLPFPLAILALRQLL